MKRKIWLVVCVLVFIFGSIFLPSVNGETFDIGKEVETDLDYYPFSSGAIGMIGNNSYYPLIFDGNLSTGINCSQSNVSLLIFDIYFPYSLNVSNITIKPNYQGISSNYFLDVYLHEPGFGGYTLESGEKTLNINLSIHGLKLVIEASKGNPLCFNDVIINYTQSPSTYKKQQAQINILNQEVKSLKENITEIKTNNLSEYNDTSIKNSILKLNSENTLLKQEIGNLTLNIENFKTEIEKLTEEIQNIEGTGDKNIGDQESDRINQNSYIAIFAIILVILFLIILKLSMIVFKRKHQDIEEQRIDNILVGKSTSEMLTNYRLKDTKLSDEDYKMLLERKFQAGKMSKDTHDYMEKFLNDLNKNKNIRTRKKK